MQSTDYQCSFTVAKSLPTTCYFSIIICHSDRYKKFSYPTTRFEKPVKNDWQPGGNYSPPNCQPINLLNFQFSTFHFLQPFTHKRIHLFRMRFEALEQFELRLCADQVVLRAVDLVVCVRQQTAAIREQLDFRRSQE